eukprot:scaffold42776_cov60-Phaeocystis_antarctica.AAC.4
MRASRAILLLTTHLQRLVRVRRVHYAPPFVVGEVVPHQELRQGLAGREVVLFERAERLVGVRVGVGVGVRVGVRVRVRVRVEIRVRVRVRARARVRVRARVRGRPRASVASPMT